MSQVLPSAEFTEREPSPAIRFTLAKLDRPAGYGAALGLVAVALVVVPGIFLAVLALFTWMSAWHLYESVVWLSAGPYFLFHLPMALIGSMLLVMLIKPLFFQRKAKEDPAVKITAADQPRLVAFVEQLCDAAGAPRPSVIEVDCEANAAVSVVGGWRGIRRRNLSLRIGLPLVCSMPLDEFAGVLAHEFGHFNQRSGLGGTLLVRTFMRFLARIVFERDRLDGMLRKMKFSQTPIRLIYYLLAFMLESARGVLWLMMTLCELLTCRLSRKMEHDADQLEAQLAGSDAFVRTSEWMTMLGFASQAAHDDLAWQWEQRRLADNLPRLIAAKARGSEDRRAELLAIVDASPARWFHTHPTHRQRVEFVRSLNLPGQFTSSEPAESLFNDLDGLCLIATERAYRRRVGGELDKTTLVPTGPMVRELAEQEQADRALMRFFRGSISALSPVFPLSIADPPAEDFEPAVAELRAAREALLDCGDGANLSAVQFSRAVQQFDAQSSQIELFNIFSFNPRTAKARKIVQKQMQAIAAERDAADQKLRAFEDASRRRLNAALRVGLSPVMLDRLPGEGEKTQAWIKYWTGIAMFLQDALPHVQVMRRSATRINVFMASYNSKRPFPMVSKTILDDIAGIRQAIGAIKQCTGHQPYPFEHGRGKVMIDEALFDETPGERQADVASRAAWQGVKRYTSIMFRSLARLTELAEKIEQAVGLEALPEPAKVVDPKVALEAAARKKQERRYWLLFSGRAAAGTAMLVALAWLSIFPPDLPAMGWGGDGATAYRPASFASVATPYFYSPPTGPNGPAVPRPGMSSQTSRFNTGPTVLYSSPSGSYRNGVYQPYVEVPANQPGLQNWPGQPGYRGQNPGQYNPNNRSVPYGQPSSPTGRPPAFGGGNGGFGGGRPSGGGGSPGGGGHR